MSAFQVLGKTVTFTAATSAPSPVQCLTSNGVRAEQYILTNIGTAVVFVGWGQATDQASANAVIPTSTPTCVYVLLPGTQTTITAPPDAFFTGITSASTAVVYVTPGYGE